MAEQQQRPPHQYANASLLDRLLFLWPWPLLKQGLERPLTDADLADVDNLDSSQRNLCYLTSIWRPNKSNSSMRWVLLQDFFKTTWFIQPLLMAMSVAKIVQGVCLGRLIASFGNDNSSGEAYYWATGVVLCGLVFLLDFHHVFFTTWRKAMQYRVGCVAAIYDKALRLSSTHPRTLAINGHIMNLASNDVERFFLTCLYVSFLIWSPLQAVGILVVGAFLVGPAFCAGVALLVLVFVPLQLFLARRFAHFRSAVANSTDQRVSFVSQAVQGARIMKMLGYEDKFLQRIQALRKQEMQQIQASVRLKAANEALFFVTNIVVTLVVFLVHLYTGGVLRAGDVFAVFTLVNVMQLELAKYVSLAIMAGSECYVSVGRIQRFLEFPEVHSSKSVCCKRGDEVQSRQEKKVAIDLKGVHCRWEDINDVCATSRKLDKDEAATSDEDLADTEVSDVLPLALRDVSVEFQRGSLTAVIGPVGGGKSALLQALVGELAVSMGAINRHYRTLAYASQDPWVMGGTIQENILMGLEYDIEWYKQVVQACCLEVDFDRQRDGDQTVVGDRGVQLSGGQRARIGLARAIYRNADVLVVDDPLSAVDARVGRTLYQKAIVDLAISRGKCVVLATHQHQYITEARCLLMLDGRMVCDGSYLECVAASDGRLLPHDNNSSPADFEGAGTEVFETDANESERSEQPTTAGGAPSKQNDMQEEAAVQGVVHMDTYWGYVTAMGGPLVAIALLTLFAGTQGAVLTTAATIGRWAERNAEDQKDPDIIFTVVGMSALVVCLATIQAFASLEWTVHASQVLHDRMAAAVLRAKVEFFDTNPLGRILNRFSADIGVTDDLLPSTLLDLLFLSFVVLGAVIMAIITVPFVLVVLPFLTWYFLRVRKTFVTSSRELKRLESMARSPVFAILSETLAGLATLRANDCQGYFRKRFQAAQDAHTRSFFAFVAAARWMGFRMDSVVFMLLTAVSYLAVVVHKESWLNIDPSILGLALSMLISLSGEFQFCIRQSAEAVNQMVSVERVVEFGKLQAEAEMQCEKDRDLVASGEWPTAGKIEFHNVSVRYRSSLPLALRKVSFCIPAGARVGLVGRTGSGKSTVVQSLFRLLEAEEGCIRIDGHDVAQMGLHALRTHISVIPQVPTLFRGCTIRDNLDWFQMHSDEEIQDVLTACHLDDVVEELVDGWDTLVSEGGSNFSVGQRQLLCLARALLSKNKILVLDELTASVDHRTDQLLQQTLRESHNKEGGTILAVAHRLDTVIDYDYVLVLDHGEVLEFGTPAELVSKENGAFARVVDDTGDSMSALLREIIHQNSDKKTTASSPDDDNQ